MRCSRWWDQISSVWHAVQVQRHGKYSIERLYKLHAYSSSKSTFHALFVLLVIPLPTIALVTLVDMIPLASIDEGIHRSQMHWIRLAIIMCFTAASVLEQMRQIVIRLPISTVQIVVMALFMSIAHACINYGYSLAIGFPLPFSVVFGCPDFAVLMLICLGILFGRFLVQHPEVGDDMYRFILALNVQFSLLFVYPAFTVAFNNLEALLQMILFATFFPVLKLLYFNLLSHLLRHVGDIRPENVVFIIEIFHSLFVSCSMQFSLSNHTMILLVMIGFFRLGLNMRAINRRLRQLNKDNEGAWLSTKKPLPLITTIEYILEKSPYVRLSPGIGLNFTANSFIKIVPAPTLSGKSNGPNCLYSSSASDSSHPSTQHEEIAVSLANEHKSMIDAMSDCEKLEHVHRTLQLLYWMEFMLLIEFTEVLIPSIYSTSLLIVYHLPNRAYYSQLRGVDETELTQAIGRVLLYSLTELLSFILLSVMFHQKVGISPIHHLAFVLEKQWKSVQAKLTIYVVLVMQNTVDHFGADYTFQFKWLKHDINT